MKAYSESQLKTKLTSIAGANDKSNLQEVFVNTVYQSLIYGNNVPVHVKMVRDSEAPKAFKSGLIKHLPLSFNKDKDVYEYVRTKAEKLRTQLGVELASEKGVISLDDFAKLLPDLFAKPAKKDEDKAFDAAAYATKIAKQLGDAGVGRAADIADLLLIMLTHPEKVSAMAQVAIPATPKAAQQDAA